MKPSDTEFLGVLHCPSKSNRSSARTFRLSSSIGGRGARGGGEEVARLVNMAYCLTDDEVRLMWQTAPPRMPTSAAGTTVILAPLPQPACLPADKAARRAASGRVGVQDFVGRIPVWLTSFSRQDLVLRDIVSITMMFPAPLFGNHSWANSRPISPANSRRPSATPAVGQSALRHPKSHVRENQLNS